MQWLTNKKSNDLFASRHPQQRIKTGPLGLQVSHVIRTLYPANTEQMYLRQMTAEKDVTNTGNGERGTGNGERGTGNGERGTGNGERGTGNRERESGN